MKKLNLRGEHLRTRLWHRIYLSIGGIFVFMTMINFSSFAQNTSATTISGTVIDSSGNPLIGVTVRVKGIQTGTSTDTQGHYEIEAPEDATLVLSYVGYQSKEILVNGRETINVTLSPSATGLNEVVVVGYGEMSKKDINSAVSTLPMENVAPIPVQSINDAVGGRIPGVIVTANNGAPGAKSQVSIRGGGTPLFVIDNVIRSQNDFENLNPNDIATYSVLKDAAATALYGARGGNGVILVTTKSGKSGEININYSFNQIFSQPTVLPKKMGSYEHAVAINEVYLAEGKVQLTPDSIVQYFKDQSKPFEYPNTDWQKIALKNFAPEQRHDLSITSGTEKLTYYASGSYYHQGSILRTDANYNNRITYRLNTVSNFDKINLKVTTGLDGFVEKNSIPYSSTAHSFYQIYSHIQNRGPSAVAYNKYGLPVGAESPIIELSPLSGYSNKRSRIFNSLLSLDWEAPFVEGLHLKARGSYNMWNSVSKSWDATAPRYEINSTTPIMGDPPSLSGERKDGQTLTLQGFITYNQSFGKHNIDFTGVYEQSQADDAMLYASRKQYQIIFDQFVAGPTENQSTDGAEYESGKAGYIGRLTYNYSSKYFIEGTFRYDGSDLFPPDKRWGAFYAIAAGWALTEENFMKGLKEQHTLDYLKLRGSTGLTGTVEGISRFQYVPGYNINGNAWVLDGQLVQGTSAPGTLPSTNFSWYSIRSMDIGLDFASLNNRLTGSIDYFYKRTTGYVSSDTRYSATLGAELPPINNKDAALRRDGIDFSVSWNDYVSDFTYKIGLNFTYYNQLWEQTYWEDNADLKNPYTRTSGTDNGAYGNGYINSGFYQQNSDLLEGPRRISSLNVVGGDLKYKDVNGDGKIDGDDVRRIGNNTFPHVNYGVTIDLGYKGFYMNAVIMGSGNRDRYLGDVIQGGSLAAKLVYEFQKDYWRPDNQDALYPRQVTSPGVNADNNFITSDFWLLRSAYVRLKYFQLGYDLKAGLLKNSPFSNLKVFVSGTNLLTHSKSLDFFIDPESDPNNYNYPIQRTIAFGINIGF